MLLSTSSAIDNQIATAPRSLEICGCLETALLHASWYKVGVWVGAPPSSLFHHAYSGGQAPPFHSSINHPFTLGGLPLLRQVLLRIFVVGAAPRSYSAPLLLYLPPFRGCARDA